MLYAKLTVSFFLSFSVYTIICFPIHGLIDVCLGPVWGDK